MLTRLRNVGIGGSAVILADPFNGDENAIAKYLNTELGVARQFDKDMKLAEAMKTPDIWLGNRNGAVNKVLIEKIAPWYKQKLNSYIGRGYSVDEALKMANASANRLLQEELLELELDFPGASTVFSSAAHQVADRNFNFMGHLGTEEIPVNEKEIYKRYRAKKKAKRAKKASKQITQ